MSKEKVIFRHEYNPYTKEWGYLAIFPEEKASLGRVAALPFCFNDERIVFEPYTEIDTNYMYSKKIVHKNDPVVPLLKSNIEKYYGTEFEVVEKIMR